jgi:hypothetical protein
MDAKELLRRYIEQRRELGESELVLDRLNVEDVMRLIGAAGAMKSTPRVSRELRELGSSDTLDWRTSLREAGVNVDAPTATAAPPVEASPGHEPPIVTTTDHMAFKKGIVVAPDAADLLPDAILRLRSLDEIAAKVM